jgi:hypothetical protein
MNALLIVFLPIAGIGAVLKLLLHALKKEGAIKILETVLGITMLLSIIPNIELSIPKFESIDTLKREQFANIQKEKMNEILNMAEKELEPILKKEAEELTGTLPTACIVQLEGENFTIEKIHFSFSTNAFLSTYEIKTHFKEKYNTEVTVTME